MVTEGCGIFTEDQVSNRVTMIVYNPKNHLMVMIRLRGSVLPKSIPIGLISALIGVITLSLQWFLKWYFGYTWETSSSVHTVMGYVLGFLIVFRTGFAMKRFEAGNDMMRTLDSRLYSLCNTLFNYVDGEEEHHKEERNKLRRRIYTSRVVLIKALRQEEDLTDSGLDPEDLAELVGKSNLIHRARWMITKVSQNIRSIEKESRLQGVSVLMIGNAMSLISSSFADIAAVQTTPFPFPYAQFTSLFLFSYIMTFPIAYSTDIAYLTPIASFLISTAFVGLNEVSVQLEDPFGDDANDLPLDETGLALDCAMGDIQRHRDGSHYPQHVFPPSPPQPRGPMAATPLPRKDCFSAVDAIKTEPPLHHSASLPHSGTEPDTSLDAMLYDLA
jgi:ion channel-forming bestrophin family protein